MRDNILPEPTTDAEFRDEIIKLLLGEDWYVAMPMSQSQVNTIALEEIREKEKWK